MQRQTLQPQANPQAVVHRLAVPRHRADLWVQEAQGQEAAALWVQEAQGQEAQGQEALGVQEARGQEAQGVQEARVVVLSPDYEFE